MSASAPTIEVGGEIEEFPTEHLGFRALGQGAEGPKKLKILPKPWPADHVPPACATLLSVASKPGLLAAAGPDALIVTSTEKVRKAFASKAGEWDVISDFTPDVSISLGLPPLRHVVFSTEGEFLVISAEERGALAVFNVAELMQGNQAPEKKIETDGVAVRVLQPNPMATYEHYMAVVLESGKLCVIDVVQGDTSIIRVDGVSCATWSSRGKAVAAGLLDGTTAIHMSDGRLMGTIPCPPGLDENYEVTGLTWLKNSELLLVHSPKPNGTSDDQDSKYHIVECNKAWNEFEFHATIWDPLLTSTQGPPRALPPRFSAMRLQNWEPDLNDLLIITTSHTDAIEMISSSSKPLSAEQKEAQYGKWVLSPAEDTKKAAVPRLVFGDEGDSVLVGEAMDLSATERILRPIAVLEEISEAPHPLPAYMVLTHQGVLMAWWVVWNKSIEAKTRFPGLIAGADQQKQTEAPAKAIAPSSPAPPSATQPGSVFGQPSTPAPPSSTGTGIFAKPAATFGAPSIPSFGSPGLGSTPPFLAKSSQPFGSSTPVDDKPAAPAFGSPSIMGGAKGAGFGAVGGLGSKPSPWAAPSQTTSTSQTPANPFSAASSSASGFAKFGQGGGGSGFSSFGSTNSGQTGFASLGQQQSKPAFPGLKTEPSGSTVTLGSVTGSSLPSWANTPAQQGSTGFGFGQSKPSSFNTSSFESRTSGISDAETRKRDEATPTPQAPPQPAKGLFGLAEGFKLGSTFQSDGTAKDDLPKPSTPSSGSLLGNDFAAALGDGGSKPPVTPAKDGNKSVSNDISTTPASPPRQQKGLFSSDTPAKDDSTSRAPPPVEKSSDDAPLPPDFLTTKPPQHADDDLPPLAGSPGVKVEAPSSSPEASPINKEDGDEESDFSVEEDDKEPGEADEDEDPEEASPSDATRGLQPKPGWSFQDSVNQSPRVFPPAPTPPAVKPGATSHSGRSASPAQPALFGQQSRPAQTTSLFGQPGQKAPFSLGGNKADTSSTPAKPFFAPPTNRNQESLRSPSPVRSVSTSSLRTRREPITHPSSSLIASIQQAKPPTPQPQVDDLEDEEDERMREQLSRAVEPSRTLEDFVAYRNHTSKSATKTGHAAQIEMIYKDINGMIDSLGWNARSIKSFTEYHKQSQAGHRVDRQTLEDVENEGEDGDWFERWTLGELEGLRSLEDELEHGLDSGRVQGVLEKLGQLARLLREKAKLMTRLNDIRRQIINRKDPDKLQASRKAPLTKEMADKQKELRIEYARLLTLLSQAEEATILLRSRLASYNAQNGKAGSVPTVDAVKRTIIKMTALAEKRNNDITLIESQMRNIGIADPSQPSSSSSRIMGTPRRSRGTSLRNSMADSPFATPPTNRSKMSLSELNRRALTPEVDATPIASKGYGLDYTLEGSPGPGIELARISDFVDDNIDSLRETARRRKEVAMGLKKALIARGIKSTTVR